MAGTHYARAPKEGNRQKGWETMNSKQNSSNKSKMSSQAKDALHNFKMETAREMGVNLKEGYNGDLTSREAGSVGGQMVKKLVEKAENNL